MFNKHSKLYQDPHIQYPIDDLDLNFADYIAKSKKIIADYRVDLNHHAECIIEANAPFEFRPSQPLSTNKIKYGALLIHGLLDTPFMMKDVGLQLHSQGLLVRSIMLPGHATVPGSLLNVKYEDWLQAVRYGVSALMKEVDQIFLVGFSTGANLSLYHTLFNPAQIAGIILLAPAFRINSPFAFASNWYKTIDWIFPRARWMYIGKEIDYTKYISVPFNAIYQVYRLAQDLNKIDHKMLLNLPIFIILSYEDLIISSLAGIKYFHTLKNSHDRMILYAKNKYKTDDKRIIVRNSVYPEWRIDGFSHVSISIAPDNPHYGKNGDFLLASHIDRENHCIYGSIDKPRKFLLDLLYKWKLVKHEYRRLTFNPDFEFMMTQIKGFIKDIEST
ncbi:MAG: alpha/beta hydrolase [Gammaproteobacteria bacterium]